MIPIKPFTGPTWLQGNQSQIKTLSEGGTIVNGRRTYQVCPGCRRVIWANKPFIGSTHLCTPKEIE